MGRLFLILNQSQSGTTRPRPNRSTRAQSMVEYALGIGCVAAVCMIALGSLGHISGHILKNVNNAINSPNQVVHPEETVNLSATPWVLQ